jgi:hypothetical protein
MTDRRNQQTAAVQLKQVHARIEQWRDSRTKRSRIPQDIWDDATRLGTELGVYPVARALRLDYQVLRQRVDQRVAGIGKDGGRTDGFIELSGAQLVGEARAESVVEISDNTGVRVTVRLTARQPLDVGALVDRFLGAR